MTQFAFSQVHPGAVLKEELDARGLTANSFALELGIPPQRIQDIVAERRGISAETALHLEAGLGTPARLWLGMQATFELYHAEKKLNDDPKSVRWAALKNKHSEMELQVERQNREFRFSHSRKSSSKGGDNLKTIKPS